MGRNSMLQRRVAIALLVGTCTAGAEGGAPGDSLSGSALAKASAGDQPGAMRDLDLAIRTHPEAPAAYAYRAYLHRARGNAAAARADIGHVLRLRLLELDARLDSVPGDSDARVARAATQVSLGNAKAAIADLSHVLAARPGDVRVHFLLGNARYRSGDSKGALAEYDRALAVDPSLVEAYTARAVLRAELGDRRGSIADFEAARLRATDDQVSR